MGKGSREEKYVNVNLKDSKMGYDFYLNFRGEGKFL